MLLWAAAVAQAVAQQEDTPEPFVFQVEDLSFGLPKADEPLELNTPRAALEAFLDAVEAGDGPRAAQALNLSSIPEEERESRAPTLALMLAFLLLNHQLIDWAQIPDQPDARVVPETDAAETPYRRRSIELGQLELDGRPVPISIQRFRAEDTEPVWLFSPFTVERTSRLYAASRPGMLSGWVPLEERLATLGRPSLREWLIVGGLLTICGLLWLLVYRGVRLLSRQVALYWAGWLRRLAFPLATVLAALTYRLVIDRLITLTGPVASNLGLASEVVGLLAGAWLLVRMVSGATLVLSERYVVPLSSDDPDNRRIKTNVYVVRRLTVVLIAVVSIGYVLLRLGLFETFGISVLASAGAIGVVVAIAAQPLLGNMVAGLQIALSDPVRIGDVVVFDGRWATVEDIAFAHTVLRTDTDTRLIVPHAEFLSRAVENWSKEGEAVRRIVKLPVDYRIDVDLVRQWVGEILDGDPRLTEAPTVEMVEVDCEVAVLWVWIGATTPLTSWTLHNEVREKLVSFVSEHEGGKFLPRKRYVSQRESV
ncbi:mechanosensitive ion channel family protein [Paracoccus sp. T5]|uniref:mechanosensitive ion channel family protein n=1 Tax=Paracoccus sp. T5 TaxID=3402161 RepID=UPI003ADE716F